MAVIENLQMCNSRLDAVEGNICEPEVKHTENKIKK